MNNDRAPLSVFRLLRIARNMKVKEVAEALMVTPAYINSIEKLEKKPSQRLLRDYASVLDVPIDILTTFCIPEDSEPKRYEKALLRLLKLICPEEL